MSDRFEESLRRTFSAGEEKARRVAEAALEARAGRRRSGWIGGAALALLVAVGFALKGRAPEPQPEPESEPIRISSTHGLIVVVGPSGTTTILGGELDELPRKQGGTIYSMGETE